MWSRCRMFNPAPMAATAPARVRPMPVTTGSSAWYVASIPVIAAAPGCGKGANVRKVVAMSKARKYNTAGKSDDSSARFRQVLREGNRMSGDYYRHTFSHKFFDGNLSNPRGFPRKLQHSSKWSGPDLCRTRWIFLSAILQEPSMLPYSYGGGCRKVSSSCEGGVEA